MSYDYARQRAEIFTDDGQRQFLIVRDHAHRLLALAGAVRMGEAMCPPGISGDSWTLMAYVDRLVEIGELREIPQGLVAGQYRLFVSAK